MALEIKELEIRMRVGGDEDAPAPRPAPEAGACEHVDHKRIVDDSVRRVLRALRDLEER